MTAVSGVRLIRDEYAYLLTRLGRPTTEDLVDEAMDSVFVHARLEGETR